MATKKKPKKESHRPKQKMIVDDFVPNIPEINDAAEEYVEHRDARMAAGKKEDKASEALLELMKDHSLPSYEYDGRVISIVGTEKVSVKKKKEPKPTKDE
jgi:hypothetical protein